MISESTETFAKGQDHTRRQSRAAEPSSHSGVGPTKRLGIDGRRPGVFASPLKHPGLLQGFGGFARKRDDPFERIMKKRNRSQHFNGKKPDDIRWRDLLFEAIPSTRCGGLLTLDEELGVLRDRKLPSLRCVRCGERIDELILRNRVTSTRCQTDRSPSRQDSLPEKPRKGHDPMFSLIRGPLFRSQTTKGRVGMFEQDQYERESGDRRAN